MITFTMPNVPLRLLAQNALGILISAIMLLWLQIRPLGVFFLMIFTYWYYKTRCEMQIVPPPELQRLYEDAKDRVGHLRQTKPTMFCAIACGCLGALAILGHFVSGSTVVLLGLIVAAIASTKYNFNLVKIDAKDFTWTEKLTYEADVDDEFMPEVNERNLCVLERASDLNSLSFPTEDPETEEEKSDEVPSELLIPDAVPEIDENYTDGDNDDDDDDDLVPIYTKESKMFAKITFAPDGDGDEITAGAAAAAVATTTTTTAAATAAASNEIEFKKGHFKRDSSLSTTSSSDEESLSRGLKFPDHTVVDAATTSPNAPPSSLLLPASTMKSQIQTQMQEHAQTHAQALLLHEAGKMLPSALATLMQWHTTNRLNNSRTSAATPAAGVVAKTATAAAIILDSDESDFEMLETDDFQ